MTRILIYVIKADVYFDGLVHMINDNKESKNIIYLTTNKPYRQIKKIFENNSIDIGEIFFIDCISRYVGIEDLEPDNCIFLEDPISLTKISLALNQTIKKIDGNKTVIIDSLSALSLYNDFNSIGRFSNFITNQMISEDVDTVIFALTSDVDPRIMNNIESLADEIKNI